MKYNREKHHRRSVRLEDYDYSSPAAYFVTICTWNRECIFGGIIDGEMRLNEYGKVVQKEWSCTGDIRSNVEMDEFVVMPNHFHGIVILNAGNICRGMARHAPTGRQFAKPIANSLSTVVGAFKSAQQNQSTYHAIPPACRYGREIILNVLLEMIRNCLESENISVLILFNGILMKRIRRILKETINEITKDIWHILIRTTAWVPLMTG